MKLKNVNLLFLKDEIMQTKKFDTYEIESIYNFNKINNLFKNFDTLSFLEIITNKEGLLERGYNEFLNESKHKMVFAFFLFYDCFSFDFTMSTLKKDDNFIYFN